MRGGQSVNDPELARAIETFFQLFFMGEGVVLVLVHEKHRIEKIIFNKQFKLYGFPLKLWKDVQPFFPAVVVVIEGVAGQNVIQKAKVVGVHLVPGICILETASKDLQKLAENDQIANFTGIGEKLFHILSPVLNWLFFDEGDDFIFFIQSRFNKMRWIEPRIVIRVGGSNEPCRPKFFAVVNVVLEDQHGLFYDSLTVKHCMSILRRNPGIFKKL